MMEMNQDIDSLLVQQFSSMATQDREVLISELQKVIGNQLNAEGCAFFLDMNNWNLQGAVCSYFEYYQQDPPLVWLPKMSLVSADTRGRADVRSVMPSEAFTHSWTIMNAGLEAWPPGCCVRYFSGAQMTTVDRFMVDALMPGATTEVCAQLTSPEAGGIYRGQWRMSTVTGTFFGELLWVSVQVCDLVTAMFDSAMTLDAPQDVPADMHDPSDVVATSVTLPSDADRSQSFPTGLYARMFSPANTITIAPCVDSSTAQLTPADTRPETIGSDAPSNNDVDTMEMS